MVKHANNGMPNAYIPMSGLAANYSLLDRRFSTFFFNSTRSAALCTFAGAIIPGLLNDRPALTSSSHFREQRICSKKTLLQSAR